MAPARPGARGTAMQVGDGAGDFVSNVAGNVSYAEGTFPFVSGITKEASTAATVNTPRTYSLQINTNTAKGTAACAQGPNAAACTAWQQFVYYDDQLFIQYWLIDYGTTSCPAGFQSFDNGYYVGTTVVHELDCFASSVYGANVPRFPATDLPYVALAANVGSTGDQVTLYYADRVMAIQAPSSILRADLWWTSAEFNVFGAGYGGAAVFNTGTTMAVQTITDSKVPTLNAPSCASTSYTGEINNLNAIPGSCCALGGSITGTGIFFTQSNDPAAKAYPCPR
jgi:hypothetical protein